ncbi:Carboxypeptidase regulatory-like domain-containing protein [Fodinibius salinus]|uniref:Carboxypeptidase regulatory-like domain-containing protein n=1 Tax=Fodinibius salinus TaxID=860790 RepID=A0A5D3YKG4_9BACT|nr:carboxypeptidase regulatory-like domain-containing protein [Fodinibius salinus]TYP93975.1 Carboxypeptidase regulatory-like domain-containing protein [Fodinibius salinus]
MKRYAFLLAAILLLPVMVFAQGTTSGSIKGTVVDTEGEPLAGANIVAVHQPTGTQYGTASRPNGRYSFSNVRVGGPYEIQVTFVGFNATKKEVSGINLGETITVNFELEEGETELGEVTVSAQADPIFNSDRTGAKTNISREDIDQTPTLSRSLGDFTRLTPQSTGGGSIGGASDRYNNILVDGATLNDVFGLGEGTPGSQAGVSSPISIDAIQEFNVDIAPFDVTNNGFTGGQVNAVTKSGTNKYTGTAYYQLRNENFAGDYRLPDGTTSTDLDEFREQYFGLSVGGPIIEDKLFFFVNAELKREVAPLRSGLLNSGEPNSFDFPTSTLSQIQSIARNNYSYDPGTFGGTLDQRQDNNKVLAKLDWNINQDHKLTFRYNYVDAMDEEGISRSAGSYSFSNRQYNFNSTQHSFVTELNSSFGNNMSNTFRAVYTRIRDSRDVDAEPFPEVSVSLPFPNKSGFGSIDMGIDRFSQANALDQDLIELTNTFKYIKGDHEFTVGTSNQIFMFKNLFVQDEFGTYEFRSISDFQNGNPFSYNYSYLLPNGNRSANFTGLQLGGYVQDKWSVMDNLTVTYGLRIDVPILPDKPTANPDVANAFPNFRTDRVASGNILWSPRLGFNWRPDLGGDGTTQIRGGAGIFSGTPPFVWISNQYSNTGADYGRVAVNDYNSSALTNGFFSADPNNQPTPGGGSGLSPVSTTEVNLITEDFKYPQSLKLNLAIDQDLPFGITGTLEGIYSKAINAVTYRNINADQVGTSAYGRPLYGSINFNSGFNTASGSISRKDPRFTNALVLDNTDKGYRYTITGELQKQFDWGLNTKVSYSYNRARSVNNGSSSRAISNWQYNENFDVNSPRLGTADYERRHRILANIGYTLSWSERFNTTISVIYDGRSGTPFSWIYDGNANGDTRYDNDLMYVPESSGEVVLTSNNWSKLDEWISSESSLNEYRGEVVPRGSAREPWTNFLDLRINQEIKTVGNQSLEITASMFNVLNFLSDDWGIRRGVSFNNYRAVGFQGYVDQKFISQNPQYNLGSGDVGKPIISFDPHNVTKEEIYNVSDVSSRWQLQFGVRYSF